MAARTITAGHGHGADQIMLDDLVGQIVIDEHDVEQAFGKPCLETQVAQQQPASGADGGVFEDDGVARHEICRKYAHRLVDREIPRLNAVDHADRRIGHDTALLAAAVGTLLVGQFARSVVGRVFEDPGADFDLGFPIAQKLPHFAGHQLGETVGIGAKYVGDLAQIGRALFMRLGPPIEKGLVRGLDFAEGLRLAHQVVCIQGLARCGVRCGDLGHR